MKTYTAEFAAQFKRQYTAKMGGTQTIQLPNGQSFDFDDRQYYSGRGSKYNAGIRHSILGLIKISRAELSAALKQERERKKAIDKRMEREKQKSARIAKNEAAGIYGLSQNDYGQFVELSVAESRGRYFDAARLAKTLNISEADAFLLKSEGKTYVFAEKLDGSGILELYHPSLSCNYLSISVNEVSIKRVAEFRHDEWAAAPFASLLGMTENHNHFVC